MRQPPPLLISRKLIRSVRITRTGWAFIVLTLALGGAALNTGNNLLYLVFGLLLSMLLINGVLSNSSLYKLRISVRIPARLYAGRTNPLRFTVTNTKEKVPSYAITLSSGKSGGSGFFLFKLAAGKTETIVAPHQFAERGRHAIPNYRLTTSYPFGLIEKHIPIPIQRDLVVYPAIVATQSQHLHASLLKGDYLSGKKGIGVNPYGIKDYQLGDDVRHLHWPSYAKVGKWMVKEFEMEKRPRITIDLITDGPRPTEPKPRLQRERAVATAASLLMQLIASQREVRLSINGRSVDSSQHGYIDHYLGILALFDSENLQLPSKPLRRGESLTIAISESDRGATLEHDLVIGPHMLVQTQAAPSPEPSDNTELRPRTDEEEARRAV